jgi:hypothetical protein
LERALAARGVPKRDDLQALVEQLDIVAAKLEGLTDPAKSA